jgi:hypothetical protein
VQDEEPMMPMQLLKELCAVQLPFQVFDEEDIEKLGVLRAAGFVRADIPPVIEDEAGVRFLGFALVVQVSESGFAAARARTACPSSKSARMADPAGARRANS